MEVGYTFLRKIGIKQGKNLHVCLYETQRMLSHYLVIAMIWHINKVEMTVISDIQTFIILN